jgi:hypothetical protein
MHCNCTDGCHKCGHEPIMRQVYNCPGSQRVIKHQHVVKYQHDTINEYDIIHEHEYNTRDVVREREVVKHNDCTSHQPNYCKTDDCCDGVMPVRPLNYWGRRW